MASTASTNEKTTSMAEAIVAAIAFFDMFDYPLTLFEVWRYLDRFCALSDVRQAIEGDKINQAVQSQNGFYFLAGRENIITTRLARYNFSNEKFRRAWWVVKMFRLIPWVKMIAVGNIIGANNMKNTGDIDFFIITTEKRLWLARFFCTSIIKGLNLRPKPGKEKNTICLSFYVSRGNMNIGTYRLESGDPYYIYWLAGLMPVYDIDSTYIKFCQANKWINDYLPNWRPYLPLPKRSLNTPVFKVTGDLMELFLGGLEEGARRIQLKIFPNYLKNLLNKDSRVVATAEVIKLYPVDRRAQYCDRLKERLRQIKDKSSFS